MSLTVLQALPALEVGGVERGTLEVAQELVRRNHNSIVISSGGPMVKQLEEEGSRHIKLPIGNKSLITLRYVSRVRQILLENKVDIVHARSRMPAWICYLALRGMDSKHRPYFITTVHGPYSVNPYSAIMTYGDRVIAISHFIKEYILNNYRSADAKKIDVICRGVDSKMFLHGYQPDQEWKDKWLSDYPQFKNKLLITMPSRITRWKGHEDFIKIVAELIHTKIPVHGIIAGGYHAKRVKYYHQLKKQISKSGLDENITFIGHRDDLREVVSVSNIVLSLAKEPEAFGRTALEALSLGVPVIAYDHGGAAEVLSTMYPSGLVTVGNIKQASRLIKDICQNPIMPSTNITFTLQKMLDKTINIYETICSNK